MNDRMDVLERNLAKIADKAKYLSEPAWNLEGCALVGKQIYAWAVEAMESLDHSRGVVSGALAEAAALIQTAEQDGNVSPGWREDARSWAACWKDVIEPPPTEGVVSDE